MGGLKAVIPTGVIRSVKMLVGVTVFLKNCTRLHWCGYMPGAVLSCLTLGDGVGLPTPPMSQSSAA